MILFLSAAVMILLQRISCVQIIVVLFRSAGRKLAEKEINILHGEGFTKRFLLFG